MTVMRKRLLEAIKDSGWEIICTNPGAGIYVATCPSSKVEHPTPEWVTEQMWPGKTYRRLRQLSFNANERDGVTFVMSREGVPWVDLTQRELTLTAAFEYLKSDGDS